MRLTDAQWTVMEILWSGDRFSLKEITQALKDVNDWNKNTVYTYLTRMAGKGLVAIDHGCPQPYRALVSREECAKAERTNLLGRVYGGATGNLALHDTELLGQCALQTGGVQTCQCGYLTRLQTGIEQGDQTSEVGGVEDDDDVLNVGAVLLDVLTQLLGNLTVACQQVLTGHASLTGSTA